MTSAPIGTLVTADELLAGPDRGRCELLEGIVREMNPAGGEHGFVAVAIGARLFEYSVRHGGRAVGEAGFVLRRSPDTVRAPDAGYLTAEHAERVGTPAGYLPGAPDLAVEVVSPSDTFTEVHDKALAWLAAGALVVLVVDPRAGRVTRYRSTDDVVVLSAEQTVDCAPAMPGFAPSVTALLKI